VSQLFGALPISQSGLDAMQTWINTTAGNLANMNDQAPLTQAVYQQQTPVLGPLVTPAGQGEGVAVTGIALGSPAGQIVYDPTSPEANAQGLVREPSIDMGTQLVQLVQAENAYQANTVAVKRAEQAYQAALTLGS
jgi:flagellar basal-body rod protein FlgC